MTLAPKWQTQQQRGNTAESDNEEVVDEGNGHVSMPADGSVKDGFGNKVVKFKVRLLSSQFSPDNYSNDH